MKHVNGVSCKYFSVLHNDIYIGYILHHHLHHDEYVYDFIV